MTTKTSTNLPTTEADAISMPERGVTYPISYARTQALITEAIADLNAIEKSTSIFYSKKAKKQATDAASTLTETLSQIQGKIQEIGIEKANNAREGLNLQDCNSNFVDALNGLDSILNDIEKLSMPHHPGKLPFTTAMTVIETIAGMFFPLRALGSPGAYITGTLFKKSPAEKVREAVKLGKKATTEDHQFEFRFS
ncbi:MAG TPA: hypothetical protein VNC84_06365 [Gammaproteobacteria bacterium]|jgi:hypothetical protein|nr:hypothetical protein [Gammaproteobacteria bacterium]